MTEASDADPFSHARAHEALIGDRVRMRAYAEAIAAAVRPGDVVLDLGCGTGILSLLAARAGARKVYAVDRTSILDDARQTARRQRAGWAHRVHPFRVRGPRVAGAGRSRRARAHRKLLLGRGPPARDHACAAHASRSRGPAAARPDRRLPRAHEPSLRARAFARLLEAEAPRPRPRHLRPPGPRAGDRGRTRARKHRPARHLVVFLPAFEPLAVARGARLRVSLSMAERARDWRWSLELGSGKPAAP